MLTALGRGDNEHVGRFHLLARLGRGGFGTVFAAHDHDKPERLVAVKVLNPHVTSGYDPSRRFHREVGALRGINSDYVPPLLEADTDGSPAWLATELIPGLSLDEVVRRAGPLPEAAVWRIGQAITQALEDASGVVGSHRDLTPRNVLLTLNRPWVIDFGLASLVEGMHSESSMQLRLATLPYAAPEQVRGVLAEVGDEADVFMLGGTLLFAATRHPPYPAASKKAARRPAANGEPDLTGLPDWIHHVVVACLYFQPEARPKRAELAAEFARHPASGQTLASVLPAEATGPLAEFAAGLRRLPTSCRERSAGDSGRERRHAAPSSWTGEDLPTDDVWTDEGHSEDPTSPETPQTTLAPTVPLNTFHPWSRPAGSAPGPGAPPPGDEKCSLTDAHTITAPHETASHTGLGSGTGRAAREQPQVRMIHPVSMPAAEPGWPLGNAEATVHWACQFPALVQASVMVTGQVVMGAAVDGTVAGLDAGSGSDIWKKALRAAARFAAVPLPGPPGRSPEACIADDSGSVYAVDLRTGALRRLFDAGGAIQGPPVVTRGRVFAVSADGCLYDIDPSGSGANVLYASDGPALGPPAASGDVVFVTDSAGVVTAIDVRSPRLPLWQTLDCGRVCGPPAAVGRRLYVAAADGTLWELDLDAGGRKLAGADLSAPVHAALVHDEHRLYAAAADGLVRAYHLPEANGPGLVRAWDARLADEVRGLTAAGRHVYAAAGDSLVRLDAQTGKGRSPFRMQAIIAAAATVSGGRVYLADLGGTMCSVSLS